MFKKLILLISIAFVVVCYAYPCLILPLGSYKGEFGSGDKKVEISYEFKFNGKAVGKVGENKTDYYYKLKGNTVILSLDKNFDDKDITLDIDNLYHIHISSKQDLLEYENFVGKVVAIGVGVLAILMVVLPNKKR